MKQRWVIFGYVSPDDGQPLFWSNADGWVSLESATVFTRKERIKHEDDVPITGTASPALWVLLP
jgi:hypothetical protein